MTSTYSISNILHIYDDLVNQKLAVTSSLAQARLNFLDRIINAVFRVIGGAWFDRISVSRILPNNDFQASLNNTLMIGQEDTKINIESSISHFIINNTRKTLFYATSHNHTSNNNPISITIFIEWDISEGITSLDTILIQSKLIITNTQFDNGYKKLTCLVNPLLQNSVQYSIIKQDDVTSGKIVISNIEIINDGPTTIALTYTWNFQSSNNIESQAILEMEITSRTNLGTLNIHTDNINNPPNNQFDTPIDPDVLTIGTENSKLYIEGTNTSMIMNNIQRNISFLNSVNYIYQDKMHLGVYIEWDYYLVNQPLYSFNVELKLYIVDTIFNTLYKENSLIINPDLTLNLQYVILKDDAVDNAAFKQLTLFIEKINYRQILIYYSWKMNSDESECQSMIDINVLSKTGLGNMVLKRYSSA